MYIGDVDPVIDESVFVYLVPHMDSELKDASPFQLMSPGVVGTSSAFQVISGLPRDALELVLDAKSLRAYRMSGRGYTVLPLSTSVLPDVLSKLSRRFVVLFSMTDEIYKVSDASLRQVEGPVLHVHAQSPNVNRSVLRRYCLRCLRDWKSGSELSAAHQAAFDSLRSWRDPLHREDLQIVNANHLLTAPMVSTLESTGSFLRPWDKRPLVGKGNGPYFERLREVYDALRSKRTEVAQEHGEIRSRSGCELVLTVYNVLKLWSEVVRDRVSVGLVEHDEARQVLRQIVGRRTYGFKLDLENEGDEPADIFSSPVVSGVIQSHRSDLDVYTGALSLRGSSSFAPVIRLPPACGAVRPEFEQLAAARRKSSGGNPHKLNRLASRLSERISDDLPSWIFDAIRESRTIKLVSDSPLEWMALDGLPLMLRRDVSRIPLSPGNLFLQQMLRCKEVPVPASSFQDVLVLRSFDDSDPLRDMLESAVNVYKRANSFPQVRFVDVESQSDFIEALEKFDGAILIFDGHGTHSQRPDIGELVLTRERLDTWNLRGRVRMPPIVILSACDTHPFDASHATVANGFLASGAVSVIGTSVPVQGRESAVFVARLLLRVGMYLPLLVTHRPWNSFRWSEILPGLQRRQFVTEALQRLSQLGGLRASEADLSAIMIETGLAIDSGQDWYSLFVERVSALGGWNRTEASDRLSRHAGFVDSLAYVQLGNPEQIVGFGETR